MISRLQRLRERRGHSHQVPQTAAGAAGESSPTPFFNLLRAVNLQPDAGAGVSMAAARGLPLGRGRWTLI